MWNGCRSKYVAILMAFFMLAGCQQKPRDVWYGKKNNLDVTIGLPQRHDVTDRKTAQLLAGLDKAGITVISTGQAYRVIIPTDIIFYYETPRLMWDSFDRVNLVVAYLKQFRKTDVRVDVYSRGANRKQAAALSYARARAVADYLWSQAIDARMIYTRANSMEDAPTVCCGKKVDFASDMHEHVEIIFRNTIV